MSGSSKSNDEARARSERFREAVHGAQLQRLFDFMPGVYFVVKDRAGRVMMANGLAARLCGTRDEAAILGKTDHDLFPPDQADAYVKDDQQVLKTGEPIIDRVELAPDPTNAINWFLTTKIPLTNRDGDIIGLACVARHMDHDNKKLRPYVEMNEALEHIRAHHASPIRVEDLAKKVNLSAGHFERRFKRVFGITPKQHITRVRLRAACNLLLSTNHTIASIALESGFYDHSHFCRAFKKELGISPSQYREKPDHSS